MTSLGLGWALLFPQRDYGRLPVWTTSARALVLAEGHDDALAPTASPSTRLSRHFYHPFLLVQRTPASP